MQQRARSGKRPVTLLDVIDVVSRYARTNEETAAVINHLLRTSRLRFTSGATRPALERLLA